MRVMVKTLEEAMKARELVQKSVDRHPLSWFLRHVSLMKMKLLTPLYPALLSVCAVAL